MRRLALHAVLLFSLLVLGVMLVAPAAAQDGRTYEVTVHSSDSRTFTDCFRFDNAGTLVIDGLLPATLTFRHDRLGASPRKWQAVIRISQAEYGVGFHGKVDSTQTLLRGEAVVEQGTTFVFKGAVNPGCVLPAGAVKDGKQYSR